MSEITYEIHDGFDYVIEEKGNTFIALRKISWGDNDPKYDIRKWYNTADGERANKGVGLSEEGMDELTRILLSQGFGTTEEVLESIKDRDDFEKSYNKVVKGIIYDDDSDETFYDPREVLFNGEQDE